jgi:hypothetical protein
LYPDSDDENDSIVVKDVNLAPSNHWSTWLGGPAPLIIYDGFAVYLERGNRFSRVVGAGFPLRYLDTHEIIKAVVDLRPQIHESKVSAWTKDWVKITIGTRVEFQIEAGSPERPSDTQLVYSFNPLAVRKAVECTAVRMQNGKLEESDWREFTVGKTMDLLAHHISSHLLDELLLHNEESGRMLSSEVMKVLIKNANASLKEIGSQIISLQIINVSIQPSVLPQQLDAGGAKRWAEFKVGSPTPDSVFVSYSRSDWNMYVKPLADRLTTKGVKIWLDQYLLQGGQNWQDKINEALETCERMILCVTPRALNSKNVKIEYRYFYNHHKLLIPLICETTKLPAELEGIQWVQCKDFNSLMRRLSQKHTG